MNSRALTMVLTLVALGLVANLVLSGLTLSKLYQSPISAESEAIKMVGETVKTAGEMMKEATLALKAAVEALSSVTPITARTPAEPAVAATIPDPPAGHVALKLAWEYQDFPGEILAFEPPQGAKLWDTASYEKGKEVPKGVAIKDGVVFIKPGEEKLVQFVYQNPTDKPVKFWVVPHVVDPMSHMPKTILKCLCTGQRMMYQRMAAGRG